MHGVKILEAFFQRQKIQLSRYPPHYPAELSLMEHVWVILKRLLAPCYPGLAAYPGEIVAVLAPMAEVLGDSWI